jgi:hypothetical protein
MAPLSHRGRIRRITIVAVARARRETHDVGADPEQLHRAKTPPAFQQTCPIDKTPLARPRILGDRVNQTRL